MGVVKAPVYIEPNPGKPEKKKIFYHEITKGRNHEEDHGNFRAFQYSNIPYFQENNQERTGKAA
jgi:hypothetical protein